MCQALRWLNFLRLQVFWISYLRTMTCSIHLVKVNYCLKWNTF